MSGKARLSRNTSKAQEISDRLFNHHGISTYLDAIDPYLGKNGEEIAGHLRSEIGKCSHLIAVTSVLTKSSQWVPWEIGIATEKNYPLATFADYTSDVPEFLQSWPYLKSIRDLDEYAAAAKSGHRVFLAEKGDSIFELAPRIKATRSFYADLRQRLGQ